MGKMTSIWLTIISFLWIMQFANAQQCYQTEEICYLDYTKNLECLPECYQLPHICLINVPNNTLSKKTMTAIADHFNITRLDIVGNISSILDTLEPPLNTSEIFDITESYLDKLFMSNTTATTLTISKTKIKQLTLRHQNNLKIITIIRNELEEFTNRNLANLPKAELLDLSVNRIVNFGETFATEVTGSDLVPNPNMSHLNLSYNLLVHLNSKTFRSMPNLKVLDLSHNFVKDLTAEPFSLKLSLAELYLSYNEISLLSNNSFENLLSLKVLYLDHNNISFLNDGMFLGSRNLIALDISFNHLVSIQPATILPLTRLIRLNLEGNQIIAINFNILSTHLQSIAYFNIKGNPLICNNLRDQLIPNFVIQFSQGHCLNISSYDGICCSENDPAESMGADTLFQIPPKTFKKKPEDKPNRPLLIFLAVSTIFNAGLICAVCILVYHICCRNYRAEDQPIPLQPMNFGERSPE